MSWATENLLHSRTFWASAVILFLGTLTWLIFVPKTLEAWIPLGTFYIAVVGIWTGINKVGENIKAKTIVDGGAK